jgi:hypothetical protein
LAASVQSYETHRRFVPGYHFVAFGILVINLVWQIVRVVRGLSVDSVVALLVAVALLLLLLYARTFALTVQDRVIRLEERLRLARVCPELEGRIPELTRGQLIALRFASDEELPALTRRVLDERITDRNAIKKSIRGWRADELRA